MNNDKKIEEIQKLCVVIMQQWSQKSVYNDPYEDAKMVGRSTLAETILEIISNNES